MTFYLERFEFYSIIKMGINSLKLEICMINLQSAAFSLIFWIFEFKREVIFLDASLRTIMTSKPCHPLLQSVCVHEAGIGAWCNRLSSLPKMDSELPFLLTTVLFSAQGTCPFPMTELRAQHPCWMTVASPSLQVTLCGAESAT